MVLKLSISEKGKAYKLEVETDVLSDKRIGDKIDGKEIHEGLEGYELEITGGSDFAGFPMKSDVEGIGLQRAVLTRGWGMHDKRKGLRLRKTVRGRRISDKIVQVNLHVVKAGSKKLDGVLGSVPAEGEVKEAEASPPAHPEKPVEEVKKEEHKEEKPEAPKEEVKEEEKV